MECFLLYMVYHSRETFNINLPVAHYDTNHIAGTHKSKDVMRMPVENKTKPLITATRQFIRNHRSFNYASSSTLYGIIGHFVIFGRFVGEPRISVLNSSN